MPLASQPFPLPFATGQDEKTDPRWVQPGTATSLVNIQLGRPGTYRKRNGFGVYGGSGSYSSVSNYSSTLAADTYQRVFRFGDAAAIINNFRLWNLSLTGKTYSDMDAVTPIDARRYPLDAAQKAITGYDIATTTTGLVVVAYCANSITYVQIFDPANSSVTSTVSVTGTIAACDYVKLVTTSGGTVLLFGQSAATPANIYCARVLTASLTVSGSANLVTDCASPQHWDACTIDGTNAADQAVLAWCASGTYKTALVSNLGTLALSATFTPAGASPQPISIAVRATTGEQIWIAHVDSINGGASFFLRMAAINTATLVSTVADVLLDSATAGVARLGVARVDATHALCAWSPNNTAYGMPMYWNQLSTASVLGAKRTLQNVGLQSAPLELGGKIYAQAIFSSSQTPPVITAGNAATQPAPTIYLLDLLASDNSTVNQAAQLRAIVAPRIVTGNGTTIAAVHVPHIVTTDTKTAWCAVPTIRSATDQNGLDVVRYAQTNSLHQAALLGGCAYLSGGVPSVFDGKRVTDLGFAYNPASITATAGGGGSMAAATYTYALVWEWRDATGQRKQSTPVFTPGIVVGASGTVAFTVPNLSLTLAQDSESSWAPNVALAIYRTAPTATAGVYYRIFSSDVNATLLSVPYGASNVTFTDSLADASITGNEQLYVLGGVVGGVCPSSFTSLITHNGRLVGIGDDEQTIWYSTAWDGGTNQPRFNDSFFLTVPGAGRITAIASLDGQLIVFTKNEIYVISGDGPDEAGMGATWSPPQKIPSDVGCDADWRAVHSTPMGVVFQCGNRLYLLSRSHEVTYFSKGVESTLASYPVVTSIALTASQEQLRVCCRSAANTTTGRILTFDYVGGGWSIYDLYDSDAAATHFGPDSAAQTNNGYVWLGKNGSAWFENSASYLDPGSHWVSYSIESAWMKPADILGFVRFRWAYLLAEKGTDADVTISIADDYKDTYAQSGTLTAQQLNDGQFTNKGEIKCHIVRQKSSAVRIKISDATPTNGTVGTGQGYNLIGLVIEGGVKKGPRKLPGSQGI